LAARALLAVAALLATIAASPPEVTVLSNQHRLVIERPETATVRGAVLLIPGGSTKLRLGPNGQTRSPNFVIRTREKLLEAGFAVAYMDDPSDLREPIARLREVGKPVVLLSTSRGTIVAAQNAARLGDQGPDLLILTSPVTVGFDSLTAVNLQPIAIPTLITANSEDSCRASPPAGASALVSRLAHPTFMQFTSTQLKGDPCEPFAPHGYLGIEDDVLSKIVGWITGHS